MYKASFWIVYSTFCLVLITATTLNTRVQHLLLSASVALLGKACTLDWTITGSSVSLRQHDFVSI